MKTAWSVLRFDLIGLLIDPRVIGFTVGVPIVLVPILVWIAAGDPALSRAGRVAANKSVAVDATLPDADSTVQILEAAGYRVTRAAAGDAAGLVREGQVVAAVVRTGDARSPAVRYRATSETSTRAALEIGGRFSARRVGGPQVGLQPLDARGAPRLALAIAAALTVGLASAVAPMAAAADLGAGERERRTLEFVVRASGSPRSVVAGKAGALLVVAALGVCAYLVGFGLARMVAPLAFDSVARVVELGRAAIARAALLAATFAALAATAELTLSLASPSVRAAQSTFLPLIMGASAAAYLAMVTDVWHIESWKLFVPGLNLLVGIKAVIVEGPDFPILVVVLGTFAVVLALLAICSILLTNERLMHQA